MTIFSRIRKFINTCCKQTDSQEIKEDVLPSPDARKYLARLIVKTLLSTALGRALLQDVIAKDAYPPGEDPATLFSEVG